MKAQMVSAEILAACRRGDPRAFEEVVRRTHRQVYTQAFRLVGDQQEAEDVAQEAYLRVFRGIRGFREQARFETWLYRIVANAAMSHLRRLGRFPDLALDGEEPAMNRASPIRVDDQAVDRQILVAALAELSPAGRMIVLLKDVYGLSCREIGDEFGISEGAVKVRLHRARRRLKESLYGSEVGDEV